MELVVTFPPLTGATLYSVIVITPAQFRIAFDTETTSAVIPLDQLPSQAGTYTWRVVPYWTTGTERWQWQQICLLRTGGTFDKPETAQRTQQILTPLLTVSGLRNSGFQHIKSAAREIHSHIAVIG
jgi:hypothetical protein